MAAVNLVLDPHPLDRAVVRAVSGSARDTLLLEGESLYVSYALHGGMGMTDELRAGHYFKRLTMIDMPFGNVDWHLKRFAAL